MNNEFESARFYFRKCAKEGKLIDAVILGEKVVAWQRRSGRVYGAEFCADLYLVARSYAALGILDKSIKFFKAALKSAEFLTSEEDFITDIKTEYAACLARSLRASEAFGILLKIYKSKAKKFGAKSIYAADSLYNAANALYDAGEYKRALRFHKKALPYRDGLSLADSWNSMGYCLEKLGRNNDSALCLEKALAIIKEESAADYLANLSYLAKVYEKAGNEGKALKYYSESLNLTKKLYSARHPQYPAILNNIADCMMRAGRPEKAVKLRVKSLFLMRDLVGADHVFYSDGLKFAAAIYRSLDEREKSRALLARSLRIRENLTGAATDAFVSDAVLLIKWLNEDGDFTRLASLCKKIIRKTSADDAANDYAEIRDGLAKLVTAPKDEDKTEVITSLVNAAEKL